MKFKNLLLPLIFLAIITSIVFAISNKSAPTPSPTAQIEQVKSIQIPITINYGEVEKQQEVKTVSIQENSTAWETLIQAVGEANVEYKDYGDELGIFISAINGVKPIGNKFWLFKVNGEGAKVGVSSYKVKEGDELEFVISEPTENQ